MKISEYGISISIRPNGYRKPAVFVNSILDALDYIREKLPTGETHWILFAEHGKKHPVRLGFRIQDRNQKHVWIVSNGLVSDDRKNINIAFDKVLKVIHSYFVMELGFRTLEKFIK